MDALSISLLPHMLGNSKTMLPEPALHIYNLRLSSPFLFTTKSSYSIISTYHSRSWHYCHYYLSLKLNHLTHPTLAIYSSVTRLSDTWLVWNYSRSLDSLFHSWLNWSYSHFSKSNLLFRPWPQWHYYPILPSWIILFISTIYSHPPTSLPHP